MTKLDTEPRLDRDSSPAYRRAPHWAAVLAALFTLPLVYLGGSVTTYRVGMAVPDWPTTFGVNMFLYNFWNASFAVLVEHSHRLYASAVGLVTIGLCVWFFRFEPRRWMRALGVIALAIVIAQGVLGGLRVLLNSEFLAASHAVLGQSFFALTVALATFTGRDWLSDAEPTPDVEGVRRLALLAVVLVEAQIVLGALVRHFAGAYAALLHGVLGVLILAFLVHLIRALKENPVPKPSLTRAARVAEGLAWIQVFLGTFAFAMLWPFAATSHEVAFYQAVIRTLHQTNGAVLLAATLVTTLRAHRHLAPASSSPGDPAGVEAGA